MVLLKTILKNQIIETYFSNYYYSIQKTIMYTIQFSINEYFNTN